MSSIETTSSGATISAITTSVLRLPMRGSLSWGADNRLDELEHVLVRLDTSEGQRVVTEAPVRTSIYGETVASIQEVVGTVMGPKLLGRPLAARDGLQEMVHSLPFNHAARGALDMAVHLAWAAVEGADLPGSLGATRERASISFILGIASPEEMAREAQGVVASGVRTLKVKVGADERADEAALGALHHEFEGSDVTLYADANQTFVPADALRRLERLATLGVAWVEEPLPVHLLTTRAQLRRESPLPLIADDSCFGPEDLGRELELDTFDILNIKPARTGASLSLAMMQRAAAAGKGVMIGSQASSGLGTSHSALLALRPEVDHPSELSFPLKLEGDSLERPLRYSDGYLTAEEVMQAKPLPALLRDPAPNDGVRIAADSGGHR